MLDKLKEIFESYCKAGLIIVPTQDKIPLTIGWNSLHTNYDQSEDIDTWFNTPSIASKITGFGVVMGHKRLACIDVDSTDNEEIKKVWEHFAGPCNKVGEKGFTTFFIADCDQPLQGFKIKTPSGGKIEIFYKNQQTVMPPSRHSTFKTFDVNTGEEKDDQLNYFYTADSIPLHQVNFSDLPTYSHEKLTSIEFLLKGTSLDQVNKNLPKGVTYETNGNATERYDTYRSHAFRLIGKYNDRPPIHKIVEEFLAWDLEVCPKNSYFKQRSNPKRMTRGDNRTENCIDYLTDMFNFLRATYKKDVGFLEEFAMPQITEVQEGTFKEFTPITPIVYAPEHLPDELIPTMWVQTIREVERIYGASAMAILTGFFTALGSCGRRFMIRPSSKSSWFCHTNIATVLVAESGSGKSDIMKICNYEVNKLDKELLKSNSAEKIQEVEILQAKIAGLKKIKDKKAAEGEVEEARKISCEIAAVQKDMEGVGIIQTTWKVDSSSVQKLINQMYLNQKNGLYLSTPEFKTVIALTEQKGNEVFRMFLMSAIDGNEEHKGATFSRGEEYIERCRLSLLSTTQNSVLTYFITRLHNVKMMENDGFLSRINWVSFGPKKNSECLEDFEPSQHEFAFSIFRKVFLHPQESEMYIDPFHYRYYRECRNKIKAMANSFEGTVVSFLAKHEGLICKIATYYQWTSDNCSSLMIGKESIDKAMEFIAHLRRETLALFNIGFNESFNEKVIEAIAMLKSQIIKNGDSISQVFQKTRLGGTALEAQKILNELENNGYVHLVRTAKNSTIIYVNPKIWRSEGEIKIVHDMSDKSGDSKGADNEERKIFSFSAIVYSLQQLEEY